MVSAPRGILRNGLFCVALLVILAFSTHFSGHADTALQRLSLGRDRNRISASHAERVELVVRLQVLKNLLEERFIPGQVVSQSYQGKANGWFQTGWAFNGPALDRLSQCTLEGTCGPREHTVIILASFHFGNAQNGHVSGEDIWAHSTILAFESLNYTLLYTYGAMDTYTIYEQIPDLVPIILWEGESLNDCIARNRTNALQTDTIDVPGTWQKPDEIGCIKTDIFPKGIPIWKSFGFHFWAGTASPLGQNWTLSPEDRGRWNPNDNNNYLGYSIEDRCRLIPTAAEREHRALILAKLPEMLGGKDFAWEGMLETAAKTVPKDKDGNEFVFVSTAGAPAGQGGPEVLPEKGVVSLGRMQQKEWYAEVAKSKMMLGVGRPFTSPSPYDAMCLGVPFISVIFYGDDDPNDRSKWYTMHEGLKGIDKPYVYHVRQHNAESLHEALREAAANPIDRYIPPWMTLEAVKERHRALVERDWLAIAEEVIETKWPKGDCPFAL